MIRIFRKQQSDLPLEPEFDDSDRLFQPESINKALKKKAEERPHIYQEITGRELHANIIEAMHGEKRERRAQTALGVMASLAGFSCLSSVYLKYERGEISPDENGFRIAVTDTGRRAFFGSLIEDALLEEEMSVWRMVEAQAKTLGAVRLPDPREILRFVQANYADKNYGLPRLPEAHMPRDLPSNFVRYLMPSYLPMLQKYDPNPDCFKTSFGYAIQSLMAESCEDIDPATAAKLVMECAVPMASLDPAEVY